MFSLRKIAKETRNLIRNVRIPPGLGLDGKNLELMKEAIENLYKPEDENESEEVREEREKVKAAVEEKDEEGIREACDKMGKLVEQMLSRDWEMAVKKSWPERKIEDAMEEEMDMEKNKLGEETEKIRNTAK